MHKKVKKAQKKKAKKVKKKVVINPLQINGNTTMSEITTEDLKENIANILAGTTAQNGFRKTFVEAVTRKHVTDTTVADALVAELNTGFDSADNKFDSAAKAEAEEIDLPVSEDAGDLVKNLFE